MCFLCFVYVSCFSSLFIFLIFLFPEEKEGMKLEVCEGREDVGEMKESKL